MVSLSKSNRLPANIAPMAVNPVMFPRAARGCRPARPRPDLPRCEKTMGIVLVALLAASPTSRIQRQLKKFCTHKWWIAKDELRRKSQNGL